MAVRSFTVFGSPRKSRVKTTPVYLPAMGPYIGLSAETRESKGTLMAGGKTPSSQLARTAHAGSCIRLTAKGITAGTAALSNVSRASGPLKSGLGRFIVITTMLMSFAYVLLTLLVVFAFAKQIVRITCQEGGHGCTRQLLRKESASNQTCRSAVGPPRAYPGL